MDKNFLNVEKDIVKKVSMSTFKKGVISSVNEQSWTADVSLVGDYQTVLRNVKLSNNITITPAVGQYCRIDVFDVNNPIDMVIAYTYGGNFTGVTGNITYYTGSTYGTIVVQRGSIVSFT